MQIECSAALATGSGVVVATYNICVIQKIRLETVNVWNAADMTS